MSGAALKRTGYAVSIVSVALLAVPPWQSASKEPVVLACLLGGIAASMVGMGLRWLQFEREQRTKRDR